MERNKFISGYWLILAVAVIFTAAISLTAPTAAKAVTWGGVGLNGAGSGTDNGDVFDPTVDTTFPEYQKEFQGTDNWIELEEELLEAQEENESLLDAYNHFVNDDDDDDDDDDDYDDDDDDDDDDEGDDDEGDDGDDD